MVIATEYVTGSLYLVRKHSGIVGKTILRRDNSPEIWNWVADWPGEMEWGQTVDKMVQPLGSGASLWQKRRWRLEDSQGAETEIASARVVQGGVVAMGQSWGLDFIPRVMWIYWRVSDRAIT